jgi:addiction module HigA family antidote
LREWSIKMTRMRNPPHPGEIIVDTVVRKSGGLSVTEFARRLGVSRVALSRVVNRGAAVSAELASNMRLLVSPYLLVALVLGGHDIAGAFAGETAKVPLPHLSVARVSTLADIAFKKSGATVAHFKARTPNFSTDFNGWLVFYIQSSPPYAPDGDIVVVVDDRTGKACVRGAMIMLPRSCS